MNYHFKISIADEKNSRNKDVPETDLESFTYEDVTKILDALKPNPVTKFLGDSVKNLIAPGKEKEIIDGMISDIYGYYLDEFSLDETEKERTIDVRLFLNQKTGGELGDAEKEYVRIFLKAIADELRKKYDNIRFQDALSAVETVYDQGTEWFADYFRYVLAHELFHVFHKNHYFNVKGNNICYGIKKQGVNPVTGLDIILPDANCVLLEVFAEYFACAYMHRYLDLQEDSRTDRKWNTLRANPGMKYFGFLQEKIIKDYNDGIIPESLAVNVPGYWKEKGKPDPENNELSLLDYAGGCLMFEKAREYGKQGRLYPLYKEVYGMVIDGNSEEALYKVITLRANS